MMWHTITSTYINLFVNSRTFGRNIAEKVKYQTLIYFYTSPSYKNCNKTTCLLFQKNKTETGTDITVTGKYYCEISQGNNKYK